MPIYELSGKRPVIGEGTWIAPTASIIGSVNIGRNCHIGFGAVLRADFGRITIGEESIVEDNVVIHCARRVEIGRRVIIGHMAMIHDSVIRDEALIGMKSMICDEAVIGFQAIIAEQTLILKATEIPEGKIYAGSPAKEIGEVTEKHRQFLTAGQETYLALTEQYLHECKRID